MTATFADGVEWEVRESTLVTFSTSDPQVALVNRFGQVSAIGEGTATITATYQATPTPVVATTQVIVGRGRLVPNPATLQFGSHALGTPETRTVTVTNRHISPIAVKGLKTVRDYAYTSDCVSSSPLAPGASCTATVTHTPTRSGSNRSVLEVQTDFSGTVPSTTPDTAFRWDASDQLWIFNISTSGQLAQQTYVYTITLNDGTTIGFRYGLRQRPLHRAARSAGMRVGQRASVTVGSSPRVWARRA